MKLIDITVTRAIPALVENVYDVWMDPKSPGGPWFGAERVILNQVVDGPFYFAVKHEGRTWPHYGRFVLIERPHKVGTRGCLKRPKMSNPSWPSRSSRAGTRPR